MTDEDAAACAIVIVVETGEYEDAYVVGVYRDRAAAATGIRAGYGPPYVVEWSDTEDGLVGVFASVPGHSVGHTKAFLFTEHEVRP